MSVYNHRPMPPSNQQPHSRVHELLDALRQEYEQITQDASMFKLQRDELEHQKMSAFQQNLYELERSFQKMKQHYEEEIARLKGQPIPPQPINTGPTVEPPTLPSGGNLFPNMMGQPNSAHSSHAPTGNEQQWYGNRTPQASHPPLPPMSHPMSGRPQFPTRPPQNPRPPQSVTIQPPQIGRPPQPRPYMHYEQTRPKPPVSGIAEMLNDLESVPPNYKKLGSDWAVVFNPRLHRSHNIDLLHTMDHKSVVCCVKFSRDGKYLATGCKTSCHIYEVETGERKATLTPPADDLDEEQSKKLSEMYVRSVCFSPDGRYITTGGEDKIVRVWDISNILNPTLYRVYVGHDQDIYSLDFGRDVIVSGSGDRLARVWDLNSDDCKFVLGSDESGPRDAGITCVCLSPDGKFIATASLDRLIRIWDAVDGKYLEKIEGHTDSVYSVAFGPDSRTLVSGSLDKTLRYWNIVALPGLRSYFPNDDSREKPLLKQAYNGHKDFVLSVCFSPDCSLIVSGSKDRSLAFWDIESGEPILMLQGHKNSVISVSVNLERAYFATGSGDCRARIWKYERYGTARLTPMDQ